MKHSNPRSILTIQLRKLLIIHHRICNLEFRRAKNWNGSQNPEGNATGDIITSCRGHRSRRSAIGDPLLKSSPLRSRFLDCPTVQLAHTVQGTSRYHWPIVATEGDFEDFSLHRTQFSAQIHSVFASSNPNRAVSADHGFFLF